MTELIEICIPNTKRDSYTYSSGELAPAIGARVWVPFRHSKRLGIVIQPTKDTSLPLTSVKMISEVLDEKPLLDKSMLNLCHWVSQYYQSPLSEVITLALPKYYREGKPPKLPQISTYHLVADAPLIHSKINPRALKQHALVDFLAEQVGANLATLQAAGFNRSHLKPLLEKNLLQETQKPEIVARSLPLIGESPLILNEEQAQAIEQISPRLNGSHRFLLYGVTGSGKTEVYLQTIAQTLAQQQQVLVLVPEIGLTPQLLARFKKRFNIPFAVFHSGLGEHARQLAWHQASQGEARLVIGTRSAVFTPMPQLGLIVIDEEHDSSFKQQEGVRYSARDTALMRAHKANIPIILGSATPSLESLHNCEQEKYILLPLNQKAISTTPLEWIISDLRNTHLQEGLTANSLQHIAQHLEQGNQVLVFINRRGYSPVLLCHLCAWIADCPACDSHLTLHRQTKRVICHHCGNHRNIPTHCQKCHSKELIPVGVGTQRLEEFLNRQFPQHQILRIDRDEVRQAHELSKRLEQISQGEAQLIVGTQMMAKGHHFPKLSLVVVVDADCGIYNQDFRAIEHLGQLLTQVAGRAGRAEQAGTVIIQTHFPQHALLNTLLQQGYTAFANQLLAAREAAQLPPHYFLALLRAQGRHSKSVTDFLQSIKNHLQEDTRLQSILRSYGPAPAPMARKAHQHRMQLLLKSSSRNQLQQTLTKLRAWIQAKRLDQGVRWAIDVDPVDLS